MERKKPSHRESVAVGELGLMRWRDGDRSETAEKSEDNRRFGPLLAILALAALETWIEYTTR